MWTAAAILSAVAAAMAIGLAVVVMKASARLPLHRAVALTLFLEASLQASSLLPPEGPGLGAALREAVFLTALPPLPAAFVLIATYFDAPLARKLAARRPWIVGAGVTASALGITGFLVQRPSQGAAWAIPLFALVMLALVAASILSLVATISAWRRAPQGSLERDRARAVAFAFGSRDALVILTALTGAVIATTLTTDPSTLLGVGFAVALILFAASLAYGVLKVRVLDIDARLRIGVTRGALGAGFLAAYVAASQLASILLAPRYGVAAGAAAVVLLAAAYVPLHRLAERLAAALVPAPREAPSERAIEAYRLALLELRDTPAAQAVLARLRKELGLTDRDHEIIGRVATGAAGTLPDSPRPGDLVFARFRIVRELGAGSQAQTFLCDDEELRRHVVLKILHRGTSSAHAVEEGRALARIRHPRVVAVHDVRTAGERVALVLEHVDGATLAERLREGPLSARAFQTIALDLLDALTHAHAAGVAHGDIKPSNVLLGPDGHAKLADFGIAVLAAAHPTQTGLRPTAVARGTPRYASPEQLRGALPDAASDQYALARTLEDCLDEPPGPVRRALDRALDADPARRYASVDDMRTALVSALGATGHQVA